MADAAFWARKRLGILPRYRAIDAEAAPAEALRIGLPLAEGDTLLGEYINPPGTSCELIAVTSMAIAVRRAGEWDDMPYALMETVRFSGGKSNWDTVTITARDGTELSVTMLDDVAKPVSDLSGFLLKMSPARRAFGDGMTEALAPLAGQG